METTGITGEEAIIISRLLTKELNAEDGFMELFYRLLREKVERAGGGGYVKKKQKRRGLGAGRPPHTTESGCVTRRWLL